MGGSNISYALFNIKLVKQGDSMEFPKHKILWKIGKNHPVIITKLKVHLVIFLSFQADKSKHIAESD